MELQQFWPGVEISHLSKIGSDHCPMLITTNVDTTTIRKAFKFLNFWIKHDVFQDVVKENWRADFCANPFIPDNYKLKKLKKALSL